MLAEIWDDKLDRALVNDFEQYSQDNKQIDIPTLYVWCFVFDTELLF